MPIACPFPAQSPGAIVGPARRCDAKAMLGRCFHETHDCWAFVAKFSGTMSKWIFANGEASALDDPKEGSYFQHGKLNCLSSLPCRHWCVNMSPTHPTRRILGLADRDERIFTG